MQISVWVIGKTQDKYLKEGMDKYMGRLQHYTKFRYEELKDVKPSQSHEETMKREAEMVLSRLRPEDSLILLDERGQEFSSKGFADFMERHQNQATRHMVMLVGGAFGHHPLIRERAQSQVSLSRMTFSHQMIRLFLLEQIYRAFTIIRNEKYHNE
jgi:23S rRNA (pseudouridine1915-N3)-methyltransferase